MINLDKPARLVFRSLLAHCLDHQHVPRTHSCGCMWAGGAHTPTKTLHCLKICKISRPGCWKLQLNWDLALVDLRTRELRDDIHLQCQEKKLLVCHAQAAEYTHKTWNIIVGRQLFEFGDGKSFKLPFVTKWKHPDQAYMNYMNTSSRALCERLWRDLKNCRNSYIPSRHPSWRRRKTLRYLDSVRQVLQHFCGEVGKTLQL